MNELAFEVKNAAKYFDEVKALDGVSIKSEQGKIFGLLGPNGAGKTTLINMLSTLSQPTKGSLKVLGVDVVENPNEVRNLIGLAGQFAAVDEYLTGEENLYMIGRLYHLPVKEAKARTKKVLSDLGLTDAAKRQAKTYSGGMRRRLDLGASLVGQPKILFLDEPTTGLDPSTRLDLWKAIRDLVKQGTSILLTTQYLEEADELADHIAVIDHGRLIAEGTSTQLKAKLGGDVVEFDIADASEKDKALQAVKDIAKQKPTVDGSGLGIKVPVKDGSTSLLAVVEALSKAKVAPTSISLHRPSLDDVFLSLTGSKAKNKGGGK